MTYKYCRMADMAVSRISSSPETALLVQVEVSIFSVYTFIIYVNNAKTPIMRLLRRFQPYSIDEVATCTNTKAPDLFLGMAIGSANFVLPVPSCWTFKAILVPYKSDECCKCVDH